MRIAIIALSIYPFGIGGAEIHAYQIAKHLSKHHSTMLLGWSKEKSGYHIYNGLLYYFILAPRMPLLYHLIFFIKALPALAWFRPNFLLIDTVVSTGFLGPFFRLLRVPYVIVVHGPELNIIKKSILYSYILKIELLLSRYVVAVAREIARALTASFGVAKGKICVIPVGFDEREANAFKNKKGKGMFKTIVFVGRMVPQKDPLNLLKAIKILSEKRSDFRLVIIGDGPELQSCKNYCAKNMLDNVVSFLGAIERPLMLQTLAEADIFVLPSKDEGLPVVIIEAMSLGVPVVATRVGGIPEIIKDGFNGAIVPPSSPNALANAIAFLLNNDELRERYAKNSKVTIKNYSWKNVSSLFERLINEIRAS